MRKMKCHFHFVGMLIFRASGEEWNHQIKLILYQSGLQAADRCAR